MFLTIATTRQPAADLGFLLFKHPEKAQQFGTAHGTAHVFYPEAGADRCEVALLLDVDPIALVRGAKKSTPDFALAQYVNDRPYAASSLLAVALGSVFRTAMQGRCDRRPELVDEQWPLEVRVPALPSRGGPRLVRGLFEPLGWTVEAEPVALDERFPEWGDSRYVRLRLTGTFRVADALRHLYVLLPVLDDAKHYWVTPEEVEKLLRAGEGWLATHPERGTITRRYLSRRPSLTRTALQRLAEIDDTRPEDFDNAVPEDPDTPEDAAAPGDAAPETANATRAAAPAGAAGHAGTGERAVSRGDALRAEARELEVSRGDALRAEARDSAVSRGDALRAESGDSAEREPRVGQGSGPPDTGVRAHRAASPTSEDAAVGTGRAGADDGSVRSAAGMQVDARAGRPDWAEAAGASDPVPAHAVAGTSRVASAETDRGEAEQVPPGVGVSVGVGVDVEAVDPAVAEIDPVAGEPARASAAGTVDAGAAAGDDSVSVVVTAGPAADPHTPPVEASAGAPSKPVTLATHRRDAILGALREVGAVRVLDLGCGDGKLLGELLKERRFTEVVGVDVSARALQIAARKLRLERMGERQRARVRLMQGALTYTDARLAGFDAAVLSEVIEHVDEPRLPALEFVVFGDARPGAVVVTTPNVEYNVRYAPEEDGGHGLPLGAMRHSDHRFEWDRARFRAWAASVGERYGYDVAFSGVGDADPELGAPTQMAVFTQADEVPDVAPTPADRHQPTTPTPETTGLTPTTQTTPTTPTPLTAEGATA